MKKRLDHLHPCISAKTLQRSVLIPNTSCYSLWKHRYNRSTLHPTVMKWWLVDHVEYRYQTWYKRMHLYFLIYKLVKKLTYTEIYSLTIYISKRRRQWLKEDLHGLCWHLLHRTVGTLQPGKWDTHCKGLEHHQPSPLTLTTTLLPPTTHHHPLSNTLPSLDTGKNEVKTASFLYSGKYIIHESSKLDVQDMSFLWSPRHCCSMWGWHLPKPFTLGKGCARFFL